jgi:PHP family Zn ribbon phosphoesterase
VTLFAIDLHNHMPLPGADYKGPMDTTGEDVVRAALAAGIDALGVTDHFALDFFHRVHAAAEASPLLVLPGVEVRLSWRSEEAHLIATFPPESADERFAELMARLAFSDGHRALAPQHVVIESDPVEVAILADRLGAMVHVAHVDRWFGTRRLLGGELLTRIVDESPVVALEFVDLANAVELGDRVSSIALIQSSDSHDTCEIGRRRTELDAEELSFAGIRNALARARSGAG